MTQPPLVSLAIQNNHNHTVRSSASTRDVRMSRVDTATTTSLAKCSVRTIIVYALQRNLHSLLLEVQSTRGRISGYSPSLLSVESAAVVSSSVGWLRVSVFNLDLDKGPKHFPPAI